MTESASRALESDEPSVRHLFRCCARFSRHKDVTSPVLGQIIVSISACPIWLETASDAVWRVDVGLVGPPGFEPGTNGL